MPPLRIAVVGAGAFGRNHLRVYRELEAAAPGEVQLAAVVDADPETRIAASTRYTIPAFASIDELLASGTDIDAASICVPTIHHAAVAEQLLRNNIDILIEKPFAATLAEADAILALAAERGRIVQIGHLERFNPAVTAVEPLLNRPMFFEAHRLSIFTPRSLDVDVVLDLMIHDLDIVLHLANSPVRELRAVGLPVLSRKVDIANVRVEFESGCIANFTASRISTEQVRKLRFFQPRQYLSLDFARQELLTIEVSAAAAAAASLGGAALEALAKAAASKAPTYAASSPTASSSEPALKGTGFSPSSNSPTDAAALAAEGMPAASSSEPSLKGTGFSPSSNSPTDAAALAAEGMPTASSSEPALKGTGFSPSSNSPTDAAALAAEGMPTASSSEPALKGTGFSPSSNSPTDAAALAAEGMPATHPSAGLNLQKFTVEKSEPLRLELENFLTAIRTRTAPRVTGSQGRAALALALDINAAIAAHAHRAGL